jgi:hypothetical protein
MNKCQNGACPSQTQENLGGGCGSCTSQSENIAKLSIAYGSRDVSLNKGSQHIVLTNEDMAFIVQSVLKNVSLKISITA